MIDVSDDTAPAITPVDRAERRIRSGKAEAYAGTRARLRAHGPAPRFLPYACGR
ncbi:hypothetical protein ACQ9ZG_11930 [Streptomyces araujoniae]|uniref:hypothetical protein n=1 Tax=Streptomyces sp. ZEA17I TaxID=2202516 RepID=UPI0015E85EBC|nr:hypothetical protein [Streptomyces sp. ZEA17I]